MNLEQINKTNNAQTPIEDIEFEFKPITSGLGFHHQKTTEIKPVFTERTVTASPMPQAHVAPKKEMNLYQNDLSLFYGQTQAAPEDLLPEEKVEEEKYYRLADKAPRVFAYLFDLFSVAAVLGLVLTVMARTISMDLLDVWMQYPNEITPLVLTLFCGFYLIYFSVFEKTSQSTLGKSMFGLRVMGLNDKPLTLSSLFVRSTVSLLNFISLGLFSYFDLQNKITQSKVIRIK